MAAVIRPAPTPTHAKRGQRNIEPITITDGAISGRICTGTGRGAERGPRHQVATPTSWLAFHTPISAANTRPQKMPVATGHAGSSSVGEVVSGFGHCRRG